MDCTDGRRFPFLECGDNVVIHPTVRIVAPERIRVGSNVIIDDFVFIGGHMELHIGNHVHIASHTSLIGGGRLYLSDFVGISSGVRVVTGSDDFLGGGLTNPTIPAELRHVHRGDVWLAPHTGFGANSVIFPDVGVWSGTTVSAGSVVSRSLPEWSVFGGNPARRIKARPSEHIRQGEHELFARYGEPARRFLSGPWPDLPEPRRG